MAEHILSVPSFVSLRSSHSCSSKRTGPAEKDEVTIQEGMSVTMLYYYFRCWIASIVPEDRSLMESDFNSRT
ncbi:hypothetical protein TNCT_595071 [Trichonephila clavata]|uniref:Uncharacterized protein n=1 Tax=Trichonephila clavata TaxID=2740835 RepID=A0A8X6IMR7_TRICU|nr:hypothetical protein TNCT_595071 [Trichonephila clavata]